MSYQIYHIKEHNYLDVHYAGTDSFEERIRLKAEIEKYCGDSKVIHILIDTRDSNRVLDQDDHTNYAKSFESDDFYSNVTVAVVVKKIDSLNKGVEATMELMGIKRKLFTDKDEAIDWLLK